jgi:hypothetical protein
VVKRKPSEKHWAWFPGKYLVGSSSNNVGHGSNTGSWGFPHEVITSTRQICVVAPESKSESSNKVAMYVLYHMEV